MTQKWDAKKPLDVVHEDLLYIDEVVKKETLDTAEAAYADYNARLQNTVNKAKKELDESRSRIKRFKDNEEHDIRSKFSDIFSTQKGFSAPSKEKIVNVAVNMLVKDIEATRNKELDNIAYETKTGSYFCSENCYDQEKLIAKLTKSQIPVPVVMEYVSEKRFGDGTFKKNLVSAYLKKTQDETQRDVNKHSDQIVKPQQGIVKPNNQKLVQVKPETIRYIDNDNAHETDDTHTHQNEKLSKPEHKIVKPRTFRSYLF